MTLLMTLLSLINWRLRAAATGPRVEGLICMQVLQMYRRNYQAMPAVNGWKRATLKKSEPANFSGRLRGLYRVGKMPGPLCLGGKVMMRKTPLAAVLTFTAMAAHADINAASRRVTMILSPQTVQVKGENGNLAITPDGNVMYNAAVHLLARSASKRKITVRSCEARCRGLMRAPGSRVEKCRVVPDKNHR